MRKSLVGGVLVLSVLGFIAYKILFYVDPCDCIKIGAKYINDWDLYDSYIQYTNDYYPNMMEEDDLKEWKKCVNKYGCFYRMDYECWGYTMDNWCDHPATQDWKE